MKTRLLFLLLFVSSYTFAQNPTNGLIAEYPFTNGTMLDVINGDNFVQTGTALTTIDDRFSSTNDAINLGGDHLTRPNIDYPSIGVYSDVGTVSFWIKTTDNSPDIKTILDDTRDRSNQADTTWSGYYIYLRDGKVGVSVRVKYTGFYSYRGFGNLGAQVISDGNWHHIAITVNNRRYFTGSLTVAQASTHLYIDGVSVGNSGVSKGSTGSLSLAQTNDPNGSIVIGNNRASNLPVQNRYQDSVDDILFYGRSLTAAEIASIANYNYCFALSNSIIVANTITENSIDFSLNSAYPSFEVAYVVSGQPFSNATIIPLAGGVANTVNGLLSDTDYDFYVRENCTASIWSDWSSPKVFHTLRPFGVIYVDADATGNNSGYSWADAYTNIQDAIAVSASQNQEIWIAEGTYIPDTTDRTSSFNFKNGSKVYGGFNGTEATLADRDLQANHSSILSGDLNGDDTGVTLANGSGRGENSYHVVKITANNIVLDGLKIENGHARGSASNAYAGAVFITDAISTVTFKNCEFNKNVGSTGGAIRVYFNTNATFVMENCKFDNNLSRYGSGLYLLANNNRTVTVSIMNTLFTNNESKNLNNTNYKGYTGSAVWIRANGANSIVNTTITNCTFANNNDIGTQADSQHGPLALGRRTQGNSTHNATVNNSIFYGNTTTGGAVSKSINKGHTYLPNSKYVNNSIGEDNFSNLANLANTSNANPLFTDTANNDFTLQSGSPAIDTGDNSFISASVFTDLLGNTRIFNTIVQGKLILFK